MTRPIPICRSSVIQRFDKVLTAELGNELVLMSIEHGGYFNLNDVATHIWRLLEEPKTVTVLLGELERAYTGDVNKIEQDLNELLEEMATYDLVDVK